MDIPYIIFIALLITLAFWLDKQKRDATREFEEALSAERQRARQISEQELNRSIKNENELRIYVVSAAFDCSFAEAEEKYIILKETHNATDFVYARSNAQRMRIYEKALAEYNQGKDIPQ